ncbi:MAG TPA: hypothetical protein VK684_04645 [Edaphobacter sp.]|jgi:hypothetical protein|nr:hypothetical protein [Edaphobacter sp.]
MVVRSLALCLALTTPAIAQNNFTIAINSKPAGKASYTIEKTKDGYHVKSKLSYHLSPAATPSPDADPAPARGRSSSAPGRAADFQFVEDYKLDANSSYAGGFITNMTTLVNTSYNINKSRDQLFISQSQAGSSGLSTPISIKPNFVLLPDYDPSALQSLLLQTIAHPAEKDLYSVLIPGNKPGEDAVAALWLTNQPDPHGTLDDKLLTLHHFILRLYKSQYDLIADETNTLMMASSTSLAAIYTRDGFVLTSIK